MSIDTFMKIEMKDIHMSDNSQGRFDMKLLHLHEMSIGELRSLVFSSHRRGK